MREGQILVKDASTSLGLTGRRFGLALTVVVIYLVAAKLGFMLALVGQNVSPVWPPSGLALGLILIGGRQHCPALWLGAFLATAGTGVSLFVAAGIATGNVLEYAAAAMVLGRLIDLEKPFERVRDVAALAAVGGGLAPVLAATMGTLSLVLGGVAPASMASNVWLTWWCGDGVGVLLFTPLLCSWWGQWPRIVLRRLPEAAALCVSCCAVSALAFGAEFGVPFGGTVQPFIVFPVMVWAALRFSTPGVTAVGLIFSFAAILGTVSGHGPFLNGPLNASLLSLQAFMAVLLLTGLVLTAVEQERARARERVQWLGMAAEQSAASILIADPEGKICYVNPAFTQRTGYMPEEVLGQRPSLLKSGYTTLEEYQRMWDTLTTGLVWHGEFLNRRKDGTLFWELASIAPVVDDGSIRCFVAVKEDITSRKESEAALQQTVRLLDRSKKELERVAYVVTHDLQEPLRSIVGFCQLLEKRNATLHPEESEYFAFIISAAQRMKLMLNELMDYSLVDAPVGPAERVDLAPLLATLVRDLSPVIAEIGATVSIPTLPVVRGWPRQIVTLFRLLLFSALSAPAERPMVVSLVVADLDDMVSLILCDTGRPVPADEAAQMFTLFRPNSRFPTGGAGLALARRIVEHHGGEISLESDDALTTISFTLPRDMSQARHAPGSHARLAGQGAER